MISFGASEAVLETEPMGQSGAERFNAKTKGKKKRGKRRPAGQLKRQSQMDTELEANRKRNRKGARQGKGRRFTNTHTRKKREEE